MHSSVQGSVRGDHTNTGDFFPFKSEKTKKIVPKRRRHSLGFDMRPELWRLLERSPLSRVHTMLSAFILVLSETSGRGVVAIDTTIRRKASRVKGVEARSRVHGNRIFADLVTDLEKDIWETSILGASLGTGAKAFAGYVYEWANEMAEIEDYFDGRAFDQEAGLIFLVRERDRVPKRYLIYDPDRWEGETVAWMMYRYDLILEFFLKNPYRRLRSLPFFV